YGETGIFRITGEVDPTKIEITRDGNNIILIISETGESLTIQNWYSGSDYQLTKIEFADGTVWSRAQINAMTPVLRGSDGNDTLTGFNGQNNILVGGLGDDYITGGTGNDIYVWALGDGSDTVNDHRSSKDYYGETGILKITGEVDPTKIELTRDVNNLILIISETGERLTVANWYASTDYQLNNIEFADGTTWSRADANAIASGTLAPFSAAPAPSAGFIADSEIDDALSLLSAPSSPFLAGDDGLDGDFDAPSSSAAPSDWSSDPLLAAIMGEPGQDEAFGDYDIARLNEDIAIAGLGFGEEPEQVGDIAGNAPAWYDDPVLAAASENSPGNYEKDRP
ncbi:MAG: hypothetical protein LBT23_02220, partial [Synergistaceae bacterium]|nr:hypothetical protein [Synergistaceae bacterium]